jgi:hypothetical protein
MRLQTPHPPTGVTSNGIMPGLIYTPTLDGCFKDMAKRHAGIDDPDAGKAFVLKNIIHQTVNRLGQPMDIAAAVCFIASPLSDFMTGTTFRIDGLHRRFDERPTGTKALWSALGIYGVDVIPIFVVLGPPHAAQANL